VKKLAIVRDGGEPKAVPFGFTELATKAGISQNQGEASGYSLQSSDWIGSRPPYSALWWRVIPHQKWPWCPGVWPRESPACSQNLLSSSRDAKNCLSKTQTSPRDVLTVCRGPSGAYSIPQGNPFPVDLQEPAKPRMPQTLWPYRRWTSESENFLRRKKGFVLHRLSALLILTSYTSGPPEKQHSGL
jgi:hypothetical protein